MKHRMNYKDYADEIYADDPESKRLFIDQFEKGWSCWHNPKEIKMDYKGTEYCYVATDDKGRGYYHDEMGNHIMVDDRKIVEITSD